MWGLVNLLPIWPLDGGQATQIVLSHFDRCPGPALGPYRVAPGRGDPGRHGRRLDATTCSSPFSSPISPSINFQILQSIHQAQSMGLYQEDEWWRR